MIIESLHFDFFSLIFSKFPTVNSYLSPEKPFPLITLFYHCPSKTYFTYLFLGIWEGKEKERERNIDVWEILRWVASHTPPTGRMAGHPGMCPDGELNQWPSGSQVLNPLSHTNQSYHFPFKKEILFIIRERGMAGEREDEKHWCNKDQLVASCTHPDQVSNQRLFTLQDDAQPTEHTGQGYHCPFEGWINTLLKIGPNVKTVTTCIKWREKLLLKSTF